MLFCYLRFHLSQDLDVVIMIKVAMSSTHQSSQSLPVFLILPISTEMMEKAGDG